MMEMIIAKGEDIEIMSKLFIYCPLPNYPLFSFLLSYGCSHKEWDFLKNVVFSSLGCTLGNYLENFKNYCLPSWAMNLALCVNSTLTEYPVMVGSYHDWKKAKFILREGILDSETLGCARSIWQARGHISEFPILSFWMLLLLLVSGAYFEKHFIWKYTVKCVFSLVVLFASQVGTWVCLYEIILFLVKCCVHLWIPGGSDGKESACNAGDPRSIPSLGRSPGEGNVSPLQCSCLENSMDRGAWQGTVHGVTKSRTWVSG